MSEEAEVYRRIYSDSLGPLARGEAELDPFLLDPASDRRMGLSLVAPLPALGRAGASLAEAFREAEPGQYFYPPGDLHATVFDFVSARADYAPDAALERRLDAICSRAAASTGRLDIEFRGVVLGRAAGLIKGYAQGRLGPLRERLRSDLAEAGLPNTERYRSKTAHATFFRFSRPPRDPAALLRLAEDWSEAGLCVERSIALQLVEHDWYNRASTRRLIAEYRA